MSERSLSQRTVEFARDVQATLDGVLPGTHRVVSKRVGDPEPAAERYVVWPDGPTRRDRRIPVHVDGSRIADLSVSIHLGLDRARTYLKAVSSDLAVHSIMDGRPLVRLEYRSDMRSAPISHWQVHAERGAFSHLLTLAHAHRPGRVHKPHDLSSLHLPVGGERYRPCLEDLLEFLVEDCGVDARPGWRAVVQAGREKWRRRQLASAVRDVPGEAARALRELGWMVEEPTGGVRENLEPLTKW